MRVTLDLDRLLADASITQEEHDRLLRLGRRDTGLVLINVLVGFGVVAVAAATILLTFHAVAVLVLGAALLAGGAALGAVGRAQWSLAATICLLVGALLCGVGLVLVSQGIAGFGDTGGEPWFSLGAALCLAAALFAAVALASESRLLAALSVLALFAALGGRSAYGFAEYTLEVRLPLLTVLLFSALALALLLLSGKLPRNWRPLAIAGSRTALFIANLGFWIGSLWGDDVSGFGAVPAEAFGVAWALLLLGTAVWAGWSNRRWVLNLAATFGGIHFYTQWFEHLGATPVSVLLAGLFTLGFAAALQRVNSALFGRALPAPR